MNWYRSCQLSEVGEARRRDPRGLWIIAPWVADLGERCGAIYDDHDRHDGAFDETTADHFDDWEPVRPRSAVDALGDLVEAGVEPSGENPSG